MRHWVWVVIAALLPVPVWANPFVSLPVMPSGEVSVVGKSDIVLDDGDYVLPLFSPDSRFLAFSRVIHEGTVELNEILVLDLKTLKVKTLLDSRSSREFAVYKSFVSGFVWTSATTLKASISDGDVNGVDLVFDAVAGSLIEKKPISFDDETARKKAASAPDLAVAFPAIPPLVLENALFNGYKIGEMKFIVQKNYWQQDNHVWYLDAERKATVKLVEIPDTWIYSLRGAFALDKDFVLFMAYQREAYLVRYRDGRLDLLYRFPVKYYQQTAMQVEYATGNQVAFQISTGPSYERRENYFFVYDRKGLKKVRDVAPFYDLDANNTGKLLGISSWNGDKRNLVVKELKLSR
jgi:hypothetical protein